MAHLSHSINGNIALITLNNPPQNRLSLQILDELDVALTAIGDSETRALLLRADGADFSFGADIVPWPDMSTRELRTLFERYMNTFNRFERLSIPTVAAVQGLCFGGGLELAVRADVIIAAETARFGHPEQISGNRHAARRGLPCCRTRRPIQGNRVGAHGGTGSSADDGTARCRKSRRAR